MRKKKKEEWLEETSLESKQNWEQYFYFSSYKQKTQIINDTSCYLQLFNQCRSIFTLGAILCHQPHIMQKGLLITGKAGLCLPWEQNKLPGIIWIRRMCNKMPVCLSCFSKENITEIFSIPLHKHSSSPVEQQKLVCAHGVSLTKCIESAGFLGRAAHQ